MKHLYRLLCFLRLHDWQYAGKRIWHTDRTSEDKFICTHCQASKWVGGGPIV